MLKKNLKKISIKVIKLMKIMKLKKQFSVVDKKKHVLQQKILKITQKFHQC